MITAEVLSPISGNGTHANKYRPQLLDAPGAISFVDSTGANPPVDPSYMVGVFTLTPEQFDQLNPLDILWSVDDGNP